MRTGGELNPTILKKTLGGESTDYPGRRHVLPDDRHIMAWLVAHVKPFVAVATRHMRQFIDGGHCLTVFRCYIRRFESCSHPPPMSNQLCLWPLTIRLIDQLPLRLLRARAVLWTRAQRTRCARAHAARAPAWVTQGWGGSNFSAQILYILPPHIFGLKTG